jgi:hypothetical protein
MGPPRRLDCAGKTPMDAVAIASAIMAAQMSQVQMAVAAKLAKMNAEQGAAMVQLLEAAKANMNSLANVGAGIGANLNVSA